MTLYEQQCTLVALHSTQVRPIILVQIPSYRYIHVHVMTFCSLRGLCTCTVWLTEVVFPDERVETSLMASSNSQCMWPCSCEAVPDRGKREMVSSGLTEDVFPAPGFMIYSVSSNCSQSVSTLSSLPLPLHASECVCMCIYTEEHLSNLLSLLTSSIYCTCIHTVLYMYIQSCTSWYVAL